MGMRDRSIRSGTELAREIQLTDWSTAGNLSNWSSGVQIPCDICTRFGRYLSSTKCSCKIIEHINKRSQQTRSQQTRIHFSFYACQVAYLHCTTKFSLLFDNKHPTSLGFCVKYMFAIYRV